MRPWSDDGARRAPAQGSIEGRRGRAARSPLAPAHEVVREVSDSAPIVLDSASDEILVIDHELRGVENALQRVDDRCLLAPVKTARRSFALSRATSNNSVRRRCVRAALPGHRDGRSPSPGQPGRGVEPRRSSGTRQLSTRCSSEALSDSLSLSVLISIVRSGGCRGPPVGAPVIWANVADDAAIAIEPAAAAAPARAIVFNNARRSWSILGLLVLHCSSERFRMRTGTDLFRESYRGRRRADRRSSSRGGA